MAEYDSILNDTEIPFALAEALEGLKDSVPPHEIDFFKWLLRTPQKIYTSKDLEEIAAKSTSVFIQAINDLRFWQAGHNNFTSLVYNLCSKAQNTESNIRAIRRGWPHLYAAFQLWQHSNPAELFAAFDNLRRKEDGGK